MRLLIRAGTLLTAVAGEEVRRNQGVLVEDGVIQAVDHWDSFAADDSVTVVDAGPFTVLPGLIDAHTHIASSGEPEERLEWSVFTELPATTALKAMRHARRHLDMGVTTVRVLGTPHWVDIALRDAIDAGWHPGPRLVCAGQGITSTGGHMDHRKNLRIDVAPEALDSSLVVDSEGEARRAVWTNLMHGADVIKINATLSEYVRARGGQCTPELTYEQMSVICDLAHQAQRKVAAHCHGGVGVDWAIAAGVDTFEHGRFLTDEQLDEIANRGRYLVPTLSPEARRVEANDVSGPPSYVRWFRMATEAMYDTVGRAHKHGVLIAAGSDVGMPRVRHGEVAYEMYQLTVAGLSNLDAITSATRIAAQALDLAESVGQVHPGFAADLLIVDGDPLQDLRLLQNEQVIRMVTHDGNIVVDHLRR